MADKEPSSLELHFFKLFALIPPRVRLSILRLVCRSLVGVQPLRSQLFTLDELDGWDCVWWAVLKQSGSARVLGCLLLRQRSKESEGYEIGPFCFAGESNGAEILKRVVQKFQSEFPSSQLINDSWEGADKCQRILNEADFHLESFHSEEGFDKWVRFILAPRLRIRKRKVPKCVQEN
eukprot:49078_1